MSAAIKTKVLEAKQRLANNENFYDQKQGDENLFAWLEKCLENAKGRKSNDVLVHLATIGKAMEDHADETIPLTLHHKEVRIAIFLARAFEDLSAIWYLRDLTINTLRKTKQREFDRILQELKETHEPETVLLAIPTKRKREEDSEEQPSKKQKFSEFEIDTDFEKWLNDEQEFLEGINA
jgi:hypothetical protein